jgi:hypothetical protein
MIPTSPDEELYCCDVCEAILPSAEERAIELCRAC